MQKVSIIIPVYNNELSIKPLYTEIVAVIEANHSVEYELLFVNDGSTDGSRKLILTLQKLDNRVKHIEFTRNFGQIAAICAGLERCTGDACVIRSADLQDPVSLIENFLKGWHTGSKVVIGYRNKRSDGFIDRALSSVFYLLIASFNPSMPKGGFDYCLLDRSIINGLNKFRYRNRFLQADILSLGHSALLIPYERKQDETAKFRTSTSLSFKLKYALDGLFNATHLPTRGMMVLGLITFTLGFGCFIFCKESSAIFTGEVNNKTILSAVLITTGLLMMMAGMLGEYLWRIHDEIRERPHYIVKDENQD